MKKGLHDDDVSSKYQAQGCITRAVQEFLIFFLKNFQTQDNFENIYYKCIPLCKYVCLELSFKVSQRLKLSAFSCEVLFSGQNFWNQFEKKSLFGTPTLLVWKMMLLSLNQQDGRRIMQITEKCFSITLYNPIELNKSV